MKPRGFILTDISLEEPDDKQSLIRLLLYSNEIELEGLISTSSTWLKVNGTSFRPDLIYKVIDAYAAVVENLRYHDPDYPDADYLRNLVAVGNDNTMVSVGTGKSSPGSEMLIRALEKEDARPLWVLIWGGSSTLAQALFDIRERYTSGRCAELISRLWVYDIQGQDDAGAWCTNQFPNLHYIRSQYQFRGMSNRVDGVWQEARGVYDEFGESEWFAKHIQQGKGPLGAIYPNANYMFEGDTPSFLHLVPTGLHEPEKIDQGGWGGRFDSYRKRNIWSGGCPVNDESAWGEFELFSDAGDLYYHHLSKAPTIDVYHPVSRWRNAYQHDFAARMGWCTKSFEDANHPPVVVVNGDETDDVLCITVKPGDMVTCDASQSHDPDGDGLSFHWWFYREPGTFRQLPEIKVTDHSMMTFTMPDEPGELHLICEVWDDGEPPLVRYRRMILTAV